MILLELKDEKVNTLDSLKNIGGVVSVDHSGRFWVSSTAYGAVCFDNESRDLSNPKIYLPGKKTTYMFEDIQGTFWFCTLDDGVYGLPKNAPLAWKIQDGLFSENLVSVSRNVDGRIFFGDDGGNLNILENNRLKVDQLHSIDGYNRILQIVPIGTDSCWIVSDEGVYLRKENGRKEKIPFGGSPKVILPDGDNLWCGTSALITCYSIKSNQITDYRKRRITALAKDSEGIIWAGGIDGVYNSLDSFQQNWGLEFNQLQSRIVALQGGADNVLWIVTPEAGLLKARVKQGRIVQVWEVNDFLPEPVHNIQSVFREQNGRLWLATNRGIFGITPSTWHQLHFNHQDGLTNDDIRSVHVHADTLWAASAAGLTRMQLREGSMAGTFPTYITAVRFHQNNNEIKEIFLDQDPALGQTTVLPTNASLVEVDLAGLDYRSRGNLLFDCIITEVLPPLQWLTTDNLLHWIGSGFQGKSDTTRLYQSSLNFGIKMPPGKYQLHVTAITQHGIRSRQSGEWAFVMPAPWYATFWCTLAAWGLIGFVLYRIYRFRMQLREMAFAVARFRLMALQAQINPHFIGNCINALQRFFYPPQPTKASEYNSTFTQLLRQTLDFSEHSFIPFQEENTYNRDYLELARLRYGDDRFEYQITGVETIPRDLPFPALFLQPILENATIHGGATGDISRVSIGYRLEKNRLFCEITDNGPGINFRSSGSREQLRKSKGIKMLRNKAATLNHLFDLDLHFDVKDLSEQIPPSKGTRVTVSFDIQKVKKAENRQAILDKKTQKLIQSSESRYSHEKD